MRRYLDTARRYRWVIILVLALTWLPGAAMAYLEYITSYEADATIWTQRTSQQFASLSPQDPGLSALVSPAQEQAGILMQLLKTRSFLEKIVERTSVGAPGAEGDEQRFYDEFSKRFRIDILGTNLFRLAYRARDPHTAPEVVLATLDQRQKNLLASRTAATDAGTSFYRSELSLAENQALNTQHELEAFDAAHKPPLSASEDYQQRQLRLALEDARSRVSDIKGRIDRSGVMPGLLEMADNLDFQVVDKPLDTAKPSGGTRPAATIAGSAMLAGIALAIALIVGGILLAGRVEAESDIGRLVPGTLVATIPEVARGKSGRTRELRTALATVAFGGAAPAQARADR